MRRFTCSRADLKSSQPRFGIGSVEPNVYSHDSHRRILSSLGAEYLPELNIAPLQGANLNAPQDYRHFVPNGT